jgi:hypothetical protein
MSCTPLRLSWHIPIVSRGLRIRTDPFSFDLLETVLIRIPNTDRIQKMKTSLKMIFC